MKTNEIEDFNINVTSLIDSWFKNEGFKKRKLTDTPTDKLQVTNKKYVDTSASSTLSVVSSVLSSVVSGIPTPGLIFVSSVTATGTTSVTSTGLSLSTAGRYVVYFKVDNGTTSANPAFIIGGDAGNNYTNGGREQFSTTFVTADFGTTAGTQANMYASNVRSLEGRIEFTLLSSNNTLRPTWTFQAAGFGTASDSTSVTVNGGGVNTNLSDITSLAILNNAANNKNWEVAVYKLAS